MNRKESQSTGINRMPFGALSANDENNVSLKPKPGTRAAEEVAPIRAAFAPLGYSSRDNNNPNVTRVPFGNKAKAVPSKRSNQPVAQVQNQERQRLQRQPVRPVLATIKAPVEFSIFCDEEEETSDEEEQDKNSFKIIESQNLAITELSLADCRRYAEAEATTRDVEEETPGLNDPNASVMLVDESCSHDIDQDEEEAQGFEERMIINCKEYLPEIYVYLLNFERKFRPDANYMTKQPEVNYKMRSILIDWMVEVADEYKMHDETLFLAISFIDRFLSLMSISRQSFQLLGTAALFISSKYEEIYPPDINEFVYITDDSYSKQQVLNMEKMILKVLQFDVSSPTVHYFLKKYLIDLALPDFVDHMAEYLCYLTLLEADPFSKFYPSEIALSAIVLAANSFSLEHLIRSEFINDTLGHKVEASGEKKEVLISQYASCLEAIHAMQQQAALHPQQAIFNKFSANKYRTVALVDVLHECPQFK